MVAWIALGFVYIGVALGWSHLIDWTRGMDWLLAGIWSFMTLILAWDIAPRRDLALVGVAFVGGLVIEWWGTTTELWHYYTAERPPIWILPAWPVAALAIDRIARVLGNALERMHARRPGLAWAERAAWLGVPVFVVAMVDFMAPSLAVTSSRVVVGLMAGVLLTTRRARSDVAIFYGGAALGWFLEYWGTSRFCWTYYTGEVPPAVAAWAHGFASLAFARGAEAVLWGVERVGRRGVVARVGG